MTRSGMLDLQRWAAFVAVALVPLVRYRASDTFSLPKFLLLIVVLTVVAGAAGTLGLKRLLDGKAAAAIRTEVVAQPWLGVVAALSVGLTISALAATHTGMSVLGSYRRWNGLLGYLAVLSIAVVIARRFGARDLRLLGRVIAATGVMSALLGLLQWAEVIDTDFTATGSSVLANLGNSNFLAAYLAIAIPLLLLEVLEPQATWIRVSSALAVVLCVVAMVGTDAIQGPAATGVALLAAAAAWTWQRRRQVSLGLVSALGVAGALAALGMLSIGPLSALGAQRTFELRTWYWGAAVDMFSANPMLGVGPGRYIGHFRAHRSLEAAQQLDVNLEVDGAHNVALDLLASGGIVAFVLLLAAWLLAARAALRVISRGQHVPLASALVAAWAAYLTQAMVSLDTPAMLLLGWVLTGALVALDRAEEAAKGAGATRKKKQKKASKRHRSDPVLTAGAVVTAGATLAVVVGSFSWLAADAALAQSVAARQAAEEEIALNLANDALGGPVDLPLYHLNRAEIRLGRGDTDAALAEYRMSVEADGRHLRAVVGYARALSANSMLDEAQEAWEQVLEVEPNLAALYGEAAKVAFLTGETGQAEVWAMRGIELDDTHPSAWAALGLVQHEQGDDAAALISLERAEELGTTDQDALTLLAELRA